MAFPVDERVIAETERELGRTLPPGLRARLAANNGGEVVVDGEEWRLFPVRDDSDRKRLSRTMSHIVYETKQARNWAGFPAEAVAIASNDMGDFLILLPGSETVMCWDHEKGTPDAIDVDWVA